MDKAIAFEWADMLESGEYPQCKGQLERVNPESGETVGYCCLGVLDLLAIKRGIIERQSFPKEVHRVEDDEEESGFYEWTTDAYVLHDGESGVPTAKVREWAGLKSSNPMFQNVKGIRFSGEDGRDAYATGLNDDHGFTFPQIAKLIREQYETL